jgi:hypothetical protein
MLNGLLNWTVVEAVCTRVAHAEVAAKLELVVATHLFATEIKNNFKIILFVIVIVIVIGIFGLASLKSYSSPIPLFVVLLF